MVSFDIVSLFTRVPLDAALQSISTLLSNDKRLKEQTIIPADVITKYCILIGQLQVV